MAIPVDFYQALHRLPIGEKMTVSIEPASEKNSGANLIGDLVRNPHGFAFLERAAEPRVTRVKKPAVKKTSGQKPKAKR